MPRFLFHDSYGVTPVMRAVFSRNDQTFRWFVLQAISNPRILLDWSFIQQDTKQVELEVHQHIPPDPVHHLVRPMSRSADAKNRTQTLDGLALAKPWHRRA